MVESALMHPVDLPFCQAVMLEKWDAAPGRFFVAYRARGDFCKILGQGVVDEFRTISGPILLAPAATLGSIYDAGMLLADERDVDAPIDQGWPPLTLGVDVPAAERSDSWQSDLLEAMKSQKSNGKPPWRTRAERCNVGEFSLEAVICETGTGNAVQIIASDAPMLPQQLQRLADSGDAGITVAVSTGNRLPRVADGELHDVGVVSESGLAGLVRPLKNCVSEPSVSLATRHTPRCGGS